MDLSELLRGADGLEHWHGLLCDVFQLSRLLICKVLEECRPRLDRLHPPTILQDACSYTQERGVWAHRHVINRNAPAGHASPPWQRGNVQFPEQMAALCVSLDNGNQPFKPRPTLVYHTSRLNPIQRYYTPWQTHQSRVEPHMKFATSPPTGLCILDWKALIQWPSDWERHMSLSDYFIYIHQSNMLHLSVVSIYVKVVFFLIHGGGLPSSFLDVDLISCCVYH